MKIPKGFQSCLADMFHRVIFSGHNYVLKFSEVMVLVFCILFDDVLYLYQVS